MGSVIGITLSSHREMWTILIISISTFVAFRDHVSRKIIQVVSDNISTVAYLNHMSRTSHELNQIGTAIWTEAIHHHVSITCCHVAENSIKPHQPNLSIRQVRVATLPRIIELLEHNVSHRGFNTRFYHTRSSGVNALAQQD